MSILTNLCSPSRKTHFYKERLLRTSFRLYKRILVSTLFFSFCNLQQKLYIVGLGKLLSSQRRQRINGELGRTMLKLAGEVSQFPGQDVLMG